MKILLVDDHQIVTDGLKAIISEASELEVVGEARNGQEALHLTKLLQPDLVMLDIDMPIMNGITAFPQLKVLLPSLKIIILSLHAEAVVIRKFIDLGVDGYLIKTAGAEEMLHAIRLVGAGSKYFSGSVTEALVKKANPKKKAASATEQLSQLTSRELEILKALAQGLSSKAIGEQLHISSRTVDTHRTNMMKKLKISKVTGLIRLAIQSGLVD